MQLGIDFDGTVTRYYACHIDRFSFWIMKQTLKAERVWEENNEPIQD